VITVTEEKYLKAIFSVLHFTEGKVGNRLISEKLGLRPASVTDMLRKLDEKELIQYNRTELSEHIQSDELLDELANLLGNPVFDPHGDPIPDKDGIWR